MYAPLQSRLRKLTEAMPRDALAASLKGIEKESLRVDQDGYIAQTPHPAALGSALTHESITTDYSEALTELITPPLASYAATLEQLHDLHAFVHASIGDELLWAASMPCRVSGDESVPIARYGSSNRGMMRHIYRRGLGWRYGRVMQTIAGVHFNYSFPAVLWQALAGIDGAGEAGRHYIADGYFALIRNFQRYGWLVSYLFGASPAICRSFLAGRGAAELDALDSGTLYKPYATSLRMSDIGYKNKTQATLDIRYDNVDTYVDSLCRAISTPHPDYEAIGVVVDGEWRQLNSNILQIENEFYSFIRPKQVAQSGERPTHALRRRGVQYVEVRALDVSPYDPLGIDETPLRVIEALLLFCLLRESPLVDADERRRNDANQAAVAAAGRDPSLRLRIDGREQGVGEWALELLEQMQACATLLDTDGSGVYASALASQVAVAGEPTRLPSARIVEEMRENDESFFDFALRKSCEHKTSLLSVPQSAQRRAEFEAAARASLAEQARIEAEPQEPFTEYLARYFGPC